MSFAEQVRFKLISQLEALNATDEELAVFADAHDATWWLDLRRRSAESLLAGLREKPAAPKPVLNDLPF